MSDGERYTGVLFPEFYEDIFTEEDLEFRFRLIRKHVHPKLRVALAGCLDAASDVFETDPYTFSRMRKDPRTFEDEDPERVRCAHYRLLPTEVRGKGYPNLRHSSGRPRRAADFDLGFYVDRDGLGLELNVARVEELKLLREVYDAHRDQIDALLTVVRLGVDGSAGPRLLSLNSMLDACLEVGEGWIAIYEMRYPFPILEQDFKTRFEDCFLALYTIYDAMLCKALGIEDRFDDQFTRLDERFRDAARIEGEEGEGEAEF